MINQFPEFVNNEKNYYPFELILLENEKIDSLNCKYLVVRLYTKPGENKLKKGRKYSFTIEKIYYSEEERVEIAKYPPFECFDFFLKEHPYFYYKIIACHNKAGTRFH